MDGYLLIDKPKGWTSFDVVARIRGIIWDNQKEAALATHERKMQGASEKRTESYKKYEEGASEQATLQFASSQNRVASSASKQVLAVRRPKVGHTGTLDPTATGLMIIVIGSYCKRASEFSKLDKTYSTELTLGVTSTTADSEGQLSPKSARVPENDEVFDVLDKFIGEISQTPPAFSAIKIGGQRAYRLARQGKEVILQPRKTTIYEITDIGYRYPKLNFRVRVSSGTYIRSLAVDIGETLGTGAYMSALRRTQIASYGVTDALAIDKITISDIINTVKQIPPK